MKFALMVILSCCFGIFLSRSDASESALDCSSAVQIFEDGVHAQPYNLLSLYIDALQTNPGCRRNLLISAVRASNGDARMMR